MKWRFFSHLTPILWNLSSAVSPPFMHSRGWPEWLIKSGLTTYQIQRWWRPRNRKVHKPTCLQTTQTQTNTVFPPRCLQWLCFDLLERESLSTLNAGDWVPTLAYVSYYDWLMISKGSQRHGSDVTTCLWFCWMIDLLRGGREVT